VYIPVDRRVSLIKHNRSAEMSLCEVNAGAHIIPAAAAASASLTPSSPFVEFRNKSLWRHRTKGFFEHGGDLPPVKFRDV
jgi:hypothetical protein